MNDQNVYGDGNTSYQFNGDVSLMSLNIYELAQECELARKVVASERWRRTRGALFFAVVAAAGVVFGYVFFLNCGELTVADVFNNFASTLSIPLVGLVASGLVSLFGATVSCGKLSHATRAERGNKERMPLIEEIALSKGCRIKDWRKAKRAARQNSW